MSARYESTLSQIHAEWNDSDWEYFRQTAKVPGALTVLHETAHWFQRQTLLERSLHLVTIRALLEKNVERSALEKEELCKVITCRKLLSPINEGLACYTQFDYFPSNFFIGAGKRSPYDAMVEFLIARRGFDQKNESFDFASEAWDAICAARLSMTALRKKRELIETPFLLDPLHDHITGYLIIKTAIADVRCNRGNDTRFIHDGFVIPLIMSLIYSCPSLIRIVLDRSVKAEEAIERFSHILQSRVALLLDGKTLPNLAITRRHILPDFEHSVVYENDRKEYDVAQREYLKAFDDLGLPIRSSLENWIEPTQTVEDYLDNTYQGRFGEPPYPLYGDHLLSSPHFGRLFTTNVKIVPGENDTTKVILGSTKQSFNPISNSSRAHTYGWIQVPTKETDGRLTEAIVHLHGLKHDFFHISFVSHTRGLLMLAHNTEDYNIGHFDLGNYLQDAYRIDKWLERIDTEFKAFELYKFDAKKDVQKAKTHIYRNSVLDIVKKLIPSAKSEWVSGYDIFAGSERDLNAYTAFSLTIPIGEFAFESKGGLRYYVKQHLDKFPDGIVDGEKALTFVSNRKNLCRVPTYSGHNIWYSFSCLL